MHDHVRTVSGQETWRRMLFSHCMQKIRVWSASLFSHRQNRELYDGFASDLIFFARFLYTVPSSCIWRRYDEDRLLRHGVYLSQQQESPVSPNETSWKKKRMDLLLWRFSYNSFTRDCFCIILIRFESTGSFKVWKLFILHYAAGVMTCHVIFQFMIIWCGNVRKRRKSIPLFVP